MAPYLFVSNSYKTDKYSCCKRSRFYLFRAFCLYSVLFSKGKRWETLRCVCVWHKYIVSQLPPAGPAPPLYSEKQLLYQSISPLLVTLPLPLPQTHTSTSISTRDVTSQGVPCDPPAQSFAAMDGAYLWRTDLPNASWNLKRKTSAFIPSLWSEYWLSA